MLENWAWQLAFVKIGLANTNFHRNVAVMFSPQSDFWRVSKVRINFIKGGEDQCAVEEHEEGKHGGRVDVGVQPTDHHLMMKSGYETDFARLQVMRLMWFDIITTYHHQHPHTGTQCAVEQHEDCRRIGDGGDIP